MQQSYTIAARDSNQFAHITIIFLYTLNLHANNCPAEALHVAELAEDNYDIRIYSDRSLCDRGVGASLYMGNTIWKTLRYYLGTDKEHMVYEAEIVGVIMGLHLLTNSPAK
jgi:hypothetical protein